MEAHVWKPSNETLGTLLRRLPLLKGVSEPVMAQLEQVSFIRRVAKGGCLFLRGDPADAFYLVLSGQITISLMGPDGRELVINEMYPGDFFGELGLLTGEPRSADAVAQEDSSIIGIPRLAFLDMIRAEPDLALRMLDVTARRLSRTSESQSTLAFLDPQKRDLPTDGSKLEE